MAVCVERADLTNYVQDKGSQGEVARSPSVPDMRRERDRSYNNLSHRRNNSSLSGTGFDDRDSPDLLNTPERFSTPARSSVREYA